MSLGNIDWKGGSFIIVGVAMLCMVVALTLNLWFFPNKRAEEPLNLQKSVAKAATGMEELFNALDSSKQVISYEPPLEVIEREIVAVTEEKILELNIKIAGVVAKKTGAYILTGEGVFSVGDIVQGFKLIEIAEKSVSFKNTVTGDIQVVELR